MKEPLVKIVCDCGNEAVVDGEFSLNIFGVWDFQCNKSGKIIRVPSQEMRKK